MEKNRGGFGENTHELEKNAKMLEKINTIITATSGGNAQKLGNYLWHDSELITSHASELLLSRPGLFWKVITILIWLQLVT